MRLSKNIALLCLFAAFACTSCKQNLEVEPWEREILAPIISTELNLKNIIGSEQNYQIGDSNNVNLVFSSTLYEASGLDFFTVPPKRDRTSVSLESIRLSNNALSTEITLAEAYPPSRLLNGQSINLPELELDDAGKAEIDAGTFFESALIDSGWMYIEIINGFPVELDSLKFRLSNQSDDLLIAEKTFKDIAPGSSAIDSINMADKYVEGKMFGELVRVTTAASDGPVKINSKDALVLNVSVKDIKAKKAIAIFPAQDLIDFDRNWRFDNFGDVRLKEMRILSGNLNLEVVSALNETLYISYEAPGLSKNGSPIYRDIIVFPEEEAKETWPMAGYEVNFRGKASEGFLEENAMNHIMKASIKYTGELKSISQEDSIYVFVGLEDIIPEYALGYFGQSSEVVGPEVIPLDVFNSLKGDLNVEDVEVKLHIYNSLGIDADLKFNDVSSTNKDGKVVSLTSPLIRDNIRIDRAEARNKPFEKTLSFSKQNSNMDEFIENLPNQLGYSIQLETNPDSNISNFNDFIYHDSKISASLDMTIPLNIQSKGLTLTDTVDMNFSGFEEVKGLNGVQLNLIAYNYYPMDAKVKFVMIDENNEVVDTLFHEKQENLTAGTFNNPTDRKVITPSKSIFSSKLSKSRFDNLMKNTYKAIIISDFETDDEFSTIYDNYKIDIKLTGNFLYETASAD